jgi:hypothetical protein
MAQQSGGEGVESREQEPTANDNDNDLSCFSKARSKSFSSSETFFSSLPLPPFSCSEADRE